MSLKESLSKLNPLSRSHEAPLPPPVVPLNAPEIPDGVHLEALWEEPEDPSALAAILSGVASAGVVILLILKLFGK